MIARIELRKEAYRYILQLLHDLPAQANEKHWFHYIPLEELRLLKEGLADPSSALVDLLKDLLGGVISEEIIDEHLVNPFKSCVTE